MAKGKKLTPKLKKFANAYMETGNATQAVIDANYDVKNRKVAGVMGTENLEKPSVMAYLQSHASGAASRIVEMSMQAENEAVKFNANKDILDRSGFKPADPDSGNKNIFVINLSEEQKDNLRRLLSRNG